MKSVFEGSSFLVPKATVLTMVDMETGYVGVLMVKSPDNFMMKSTASFVDKLRAEKTRLIYDNEPAMRQLAEKIATFRHPRTTNQLCRTSKCWRVERAHQSIHAAARGGRTFVREPGRTLCLYTCSSSGRGTRYKRHLLPFVEACMIRVSRDPSRS